MAETVITISSNSDILVREVQRALQTALEGAFLETIAYLERESPVGVSPTAESLKGNWDFVENIAVGLDLRFSFTITNQADASLERVIGRGPGKFPPFGTGSSLALWGASRGIPAFLVARKIATEGTTRWQGGRNANILGAERDGSVDDQSNVNVIFNREFNKLWGAVQI